MKFNINLHLNNKTEGKTEKKKERGYIYDFEEVSDLVFKKYQRRNKKHGKNLI